MCNPIIAKILEVNGKNARALVNNKEVEINTELLKVKKDDYILLAGDVAVEKISKKEVKLMLSEK